MKSLRLLVCILASAASALAAANRPNFVIINIDDLGYADIGPFGSTNKTPHLDRMAREGRKLTSHYAAPVCSPSRAALLTGSYAKRALPIPHVLFPGSAVGLHPDERTIAEILKEAGYATACIGKWHLGDQPEFLPTRQGFDYSFGIPYSNDMGPIADGAKHNPYQAAPDPAVVAAKAAKAAKTQGADEAGIRQNQPPLPLLENDKVIGRVRQAEQFALTDRITEKAVAFIRDRKDGPFFLYVPHAAVHFPLYPKTALDGRVPQKPIGDWAEEVDASVGRILDTLRELRLDRSTLVIFVSDNGGALNHGSSNSPLRGSKGQIFEGGVRVCTIAWWPGRIPAGTSSDAITTMMDILPTFARLAGATPPRDRRIDGVDIWPVLAGERMARPPRDEFHYFRGLVLEAVRSARWKLHLASGELYDLENDIGEKHNVASAHGPVVERLRALAAKMDGDLGVNGIGPGCRALGRVANPLPLIAHDGTVRPEARAKTAQFP
jgi:arylsulfatase A